MGGLRTRIMPVVQIGFESNNKNVKGSIDRSNWGFLVLLGYEF